MTDADPAETGVWRAGNVGLSLPILVGFVVYLTALAKGSRLLDDPDTYLHVAVGRWMIAHRTIPDHDPFSYSMRGVAWVPHEWLAEISAAWLHDTVGWAAMVVAAALCFAVTFTILTHALLRYLAPSHALLAVILAWALCFPHLLARPHLPGLMLLTAWVAILVAARCSTGAPPFVAALLLTPWANLHGSFMLALVLAAFFAAEAVLDAPDGRARRDEARRWAIFLAASLVAAFLTPNGLAGMLLPLRFSQMDFVQSTVSEWRSPEFQHPQPLEFWLMLVLLGALSLRIRIPVTRTALLLVLVHMALTHRRHAEILGLVAPLVLAPALGPQLRKFAFPLVDHLLGRRTAAIRSGGIAFAAALAAGALIINTGIAHDSGRYAPAAAISTVQRQNITGPVLNDYSFGDYLIFSGIPPFVDGRADMYGDAFLRRAAQLAELPLLLAQYRIVWTLFKPDNPRVVLLDNLPGWQRFYADDVAVVHIRRDKGAH
jgi:hypothetical protein